MDMDASNLPSRFPVGTRYVIEGRRGKTGKLHIISRQLILPSGQSFDLKVGHKSTQAGRSSSRSKRAAASQA
jgi:hypothetical protein